MSSARPPSPGPDLWVCHLGLVPYATALAIQDKIRTRRQEGSLPDTLLLLEHPPVYTVGRRAAAEELPFPADFYRGRGIDIVATDRGGRITYHGPGQLVGYPIMAVDDVGRFVRTMESAIVSALAEEGVRSRARPQDGPDYTGVWVQERKIASIGVHVQRHVTTHGFAVNVATDLTPFSWIVACGLPDVAMTSLALERPAARLAPDADDCASEMRCFRRRMADRFCAAHGRRQRLVTTRALAIDGDLAAARATTAATGEPSGASPRGDGRMVVTA
jgi:lipoyl(octanoyl) transferase